MKDYNFFRVTHEYEVLSNHLLQTGGVFSEDLLYYVKYVSR